MMSVVDGVGTDATTSREYFTVISIVIMMVFGAFIGWDVVDSFGSCRIDAAVPLRHHVENSVDVVANDTPNIDFPTIWLIYCR